jgi:hypothetical protein
MPGIREMLIFTFLISSLLGAIVNTGSCGASISIRFRLSLLFAFLLTLTTSIVNYYLGFQGEIFLEGVWRLFFFTVFTLIGTIGIELMLGEAEKFRK